MAVEEVCLVAPMSESGAKSIAVQEFGIEIPDEEADEIKTVQQGVQTDSCRWRRTSDVRTRSYSH